MSTCDRIVVLNFGSVIASGTPDEIRRHHEVRAAYLGDEQPIEPDPAASVGTPS